VNIHNVSTSDVHYILKNTKLDSVPDSNLLKKVGVLRRDPGVFSAWTDATCIITKDNFMHVYPSKDERGPPNDSSKKPR